MAFVRDIFRIWLNFLDGLKCVHAVTAPTMVSGVQQSATAILNGPDDLEEFLAAASIDGYLEGSGDPALPTSLTYTLHVAGPRIIAQSLKRRFDNEDAVQLKIISSEPFSDSELSSNVPVSITVCSRSVTPSEGLRRVRSWIEKLKT